MKRFIISIFFFCTFLTAGTDETFAQQKFENAQQSVEKLIYGETLSQAPVSICAITGDGRRIVDINSETMLIPASNMKLISSGAAIHHFGPEHRYETAIGHDGEILDGVLKGNLYITGGADPTRGSIDSIAVPLETTFEQWESMVRKAGISRIE